MREIDLYLCICYKLTFLQIHCILYVQIKSSRSSGFPGGRHQMGNQGMGGISLPKYFLEQASFGAFFCDSSDKLFATEFFFVPYLTLFAGSFLARLEMLTPLDTSASSPLNPSANELSPISVEKRKYMESWRPNKVIKCPS